MANPPVATTILAYATAALNAAMRVRTILRMARISAVWQPVLTALRLPGWPPRARPVKGLGIRRLRYIRFQFFGGGGRVTGRTHGSAMQVICMFVCNEHSGVVTDQFRTSPKHSVMDVGTHPQDFKGESPMLRMFA